MLRMMRSREWKMMMLRIYENMVLGRGRMKIMMLRRTTDPKSGMKRMIMLMLRDEVEVDETHTLCEPAQLTCTWTCHKSQ